MTYSRNWSYLFKTEQSCPSIIIFVAFFVLPPILSSKNAEMANEHLCGNANLENDINMSLKQQFLILKNNITFHKLKQKQIIIEIISSIYNSFSHRFIIPLHHTNTIIDTQHTISRSIFTNIKTVVFFWPCNSLRDVAAAVSELNLTNPYPFDSAACGCIETIQNINYPFFLFNSRFHILFIYLGF